VDLAFRYVTATSSQFLPDTMTTYSRLSVQWQGCSGTETRSVGLCVMPAVLQQAEAQRFQALFGSLDFSHQAMVHDVTKQTEERRKAAATKAAEELAKAAQIGQLPGLPQ